MNRLEGSMVYCSGAIDLIPGNGRAWRDEISEFLHSLGVGVINPLDKPISNSVYDEGPDFANYVRELKLRHYFDEVRKVVKNVVRADLHLVDLSNWVTVYLDMDYHHCGTYSEITYAALERKPILIVCRQGKEYIPSWLFGLHPHETFFSNWEEYKVYIKHIAYHDNVDDLNGRWKFLDYDKIFGVKNDKLDNRGNPVLEGALP